MSKLLDKCEEYFHSTDFYEILDVERDATEKQLKKAYHRLSLLVHPDRVEKNKQAEATEKFKVLGRIHAILQTKNKRTAYDETGMFDDSDYSLDSDNWMDYWRALFKPISLNDIQKYEQEYIGSDKELRDIKKAYETGKGSMNTILEMVPFSNCDNEERIIGVVRKMVDDGEVEEYKRFFHEKKASKERRRKKYDKERKESEKIDADEELEKQMKERREQRTSDFFDLISNIEAKYGKTTKKRKAIEENTSTKRVTRSKK